MWSKRAKNFLPQYTQLHLGQPIAQAAMNAEAKTEMLAGVLAIDEQAFGLVDLVGVVIAGEIPHAYPIPFADLLPTDLGVCHCGAAHVGDG